VGPLVGRAVGAAEVGTALGRLVVGVAVVGTALGTGVGSEVGEAVELTTAKIFFVHDQVRHDHHNDACLWRTDFQE
jgi:hypothetical protein